MRNNDPVLLSMVGIAGVKYSVRDVVDYKELAKTAEGDQLDLVGKEFGVDRHPNESDYTCRKRVVKVAR